MYKRTGRKVELGGEERYVIWLSNRWAAADAETRD
jgi:hypothetical protein